MKIVKKILIIVGITIFSIFLILLVTPILFKGKILKIAKTELNKMLEAQVDFSDLKLSFIRNFPNAYVGLENLSITGKGEFDGETLVAFKNFSVTVDIKSVINIDNIRVKSILLDHPIINAHIAENGNANWNIMKPGDEEKKPTEETPTAKAPDDKSTPKKDSKIKVALNKFEIRNAKLSFQDDKNKMTAKVNDLNYILQGDMALDNVDLQMKLDIVDINFLMGGIHMLTNARVGFASEVTADIKNMTFTLKDNKFNLNEIILKFAGSAQIPGNDINIDMTFATETIDFKNVLQLVPDVYMKGFESIKTSGSFALSGDIKGTYNGKQMPNAKISFSIDNAMFKYPDLPKSVNNINVKLNAFYDGAALDNSTLDLDKFHFEMAGNPFDAELHVKTPESDLQAMAKFLGKVDFNSLVDIVPLDNVTLKGLLECDFSLAGRMSTIEKKQYESFDAKGMIKLSGIDFKSPDFTQAVKINNTQLNLSPRRVELVDFDAVIGKTDINMNGTLENFIPYIFKGTTVNGNLNLKSNNIDLNELMGPPKEHDKKPEERSADSSPMSVIEVPKNIDFAMRINIGNLLFDKLKITNTVGALLVKDGKVQMQNLGMNLLEGSMTLTGEYNTQNIKVPSVNFDMNIKQFDVKSAISSFDILEKILPQPQNYDGKVSATLTLNSILDEHLSPIMNTVASKGQLQTHNLKIQNSELFGTMANLLKNESWREPTLNNVNIKYEIKNGELTIEPIRMNVAQTAFELTGGQNLDMSLKYKINATVPISAVGSGATDILSKIPGNVKINEFKLTGLIGGTATKPVVTLSTADITASIAAAAKEQLKAEVDKQINAIMAEAEKQAQTIRNTAKQAANRVRQEANAAANNLEAAAKNPFEKAAAKIAANKLRDEGNDKARKLEQEAENQIKNLMDAAKKKADDLRKG